MSADRPSGSPVLPRAPKSTLLDRQLTWAVCKREWPQVLDLLRSGARSLCGDVSSALTVAIEGGIPMSIELITAAGGLNQLNHSLRTPLTEAARLGRVAHARQLLAAGADVHAGDEYSTPLIYACAQHSGNNLAMLDLLLSHGADAQAQSPTGATALHYAATSTSAQAPEVIDRLMTLNLSVHAQDQHGQTPLHWATSDASGARTALHLLRMGASPDVQDVAGRSAWTFARSVGGDMRAVFEAHRASCEIAAVLEPARASNRACVP